MDKTVIIISVSRNYMLFLNIDIVRVCTKLGEIKTKNIRWNRAREIERGRERRNINIQRYNLLSCKPTTKNRNENILCFKSNTHSYKQAYNIWAHTFNKDFMRLPNVLCAIHDINQTNFVWQRSSVGGSHEQYFISFLPHSNLSCRSILFQTDSFHFVVPISICCAPFVSVCLGFDNIECVSVQKPRIEATATNKHREIQHETERKNNNRTLYMRHGIEWNSRRQRGKEKILWTYRVQIHLKVFRCMSRK